MGTEESDSSRIIAMGTASIPMPVYARQAVIPESHSQGSSGSPLNRTGGSEGKTWAQILADAAGSCLET
jgi:hypothetical protein